MNGFCEGLCAFMPIVVGATGGMLLMKGVTVDNFLVALSGLIIIIVSMIANLILKA